MRGGWGIGYERNFGNVTFNVIQNPPAYAVVDLNAGSDVPVIPITRDNAGPLAGTGSKVLPKTSLRWVDENIKTAYAHFWSLSLQRQLNQRTVASIDYSGSAGNDLYSLEDPNRFHLFECWKDQAALDEHFKTPHLLKFREDVGKLKLTRDIVRYTAEELKQ